jgi:ankyrin repeat protein
MRGDNVPLETIETLAEKNPEVFQCPDGEGCIPLHVACYEGSMQVVSFLSKQFPGTTQMKTNEYGFTPLQFVCRRGDEATVKVVESTCFLGQSLRRIAMDICHFIGRAMAEPRIESFAF